MVSLKRIVIGSLVLFLILTTLVSAPTDPLITDLTPPFAAPGETIDILNITIAAGMDGNVTQIIIVSNNTNDADIANVSLYLENGTSDVLLGYATFANGNITFNQGNADGGAGAGNLSRNGDYVNVSAGANITIYLKYTINLSAASGNILDASIPAYGITIYNGTDYLNYTDNVEDPEGNTIIDGDAPMVNLTSPANGTTDLDGDVTFQCNATDAHSGVRNITLYHNISGQFVANATTDVSVNGQLVNFTLENLTNGTYAWNCKACDNVSNCGFAGENRTVIVPTIGINVTNAAPLWAKAGDEVTVLKLSVHNNFDANKTIAQVKIRPNNENDADVSNISLYFENDTVDGFSSGDYSLGWTNQFDSYDIEFRYTYTDGTTNQGDLGEGVNISSHENVVLYVVYTINTSLSASSDGNVVDAKVPTGAISDIDWNSYEPNTPNPAGNTTLDTIPPSIAFNPPTTQTGNHSLGYINANANASDDRSGLDTITIYLYNTTTLINSTNCKTPSCTYNFTGLQQGTYYLNATANDTAGNTNKTNTRTITLDTTEPSIAFNPPTTQTGNHSLGYINANANASDDRSGLDTITIYLYNTTTLINSTNCKTPSCTYNFTGLQQGTYYLNATANDTAGNTNKTNTRTITLDTTNPNITINHPVEGGDYSGLVVVNATIEDELSGVALVYYQLSNKTGNVTSWISMNNAFGFYNATLNTSEITSKFGDGNYTITINASDNAGNLNDTQRVEITIDNTPPSIDSPVFATPTNQNTSIRINATFTDSTSGASSCWFSVTNETGNVVISSSIMDNDAGNVNTTNATITALADGTYNVSVTCNDTAGNTNTSKSAELLVDTAGPVITIISIGNNNWLSQVINITVNMTDSGVGIDNNTVYLYLWNSTFVNVTQMHNISTGTFIVELNTLHSPDGIYNITITANDTLSNNNTVSIANITIDNTPPVPEFGTPTPANGTYASGMQEINVTASLTCVDNRCPNNMTTEIFVDGTLKQECNNSLICIYTWNTSQYSNGNHNITTMVYEFDYDLTYYMNKGPINSTTRWIYVDNMAPNITADLETYYHGVISISANVTDLWSGVDNNTVYLYIWNSTFVNVTQMHNVSASNFTAEINTSAFTEGYYNVTIYANDSINSGFNNSCNYTTAIVIDNSAPIMTYINLSDSIVRANTTISIESDGNDTLGLKDCWYYLKHQNGTSITSSSIGINCSGDRTVHDLPDGTYYIWIYATNYVDVTTSMNATIIVDNTNPAAVINSPTNGSCQKGMITINYMLYDLNSETCRWNYSSNTWNVAACGNGTFWFNTSLCTDGGACKIQINANDSACNENSTEITLDVDNSPPVITYINLSDSIVRANTTINIESDGNDPEGLINCSVELYNLTNVQIASGSKPISYASGAECDGSYTIPDVADGVYYLRIRATNHCGTETLLSTNITIDNTAPLLSLGEPGEGTYPASTTLNFSWNVSDNIADNLTCRLTVDAGTTAINSTNGIETTKEKTGLSEGAHNWSVTCEDGAGNSRSSALRTFTIDLTAPVIGFVSPPTAANNSFLRQGFIYLVWDYTEVNVANITARFFNSTGVVAESATGENFTNLTISNTNGQYWYNVTICDKAGNCAATQTRRVTLDSDLPQINISLSRQTAEYYSDFVQIDYSVSDVNIDSISAYIKYPNGTIVNLTGNVTLIPAQLVIGTYTVNVTANDLAGNVNNKGVTFTVADTVTPAIYYIQVSKNAARPNESVSLRVNVSEDAVVTIIIANTTLNLTYNASAGLYDGIISATTDGTYTINITAKDYGNNTAFNDSIIFIVDSVLPSAAITINQTTRTPVNMTVYGGDLNPVNMTLYENSTLLMVWNVSGNHTYQWNQSNGRYNLTLVVEDRAGNVNTTTSLVTVDNAVITITGFQDGGTVSPGAVVPISLSISGVRVFSVSGIVTGPTGINYTLNFTNMSGGLYSANFTNATEPGEYLVNITIVDEVGVRQETRRFYSHASTRRQRCGDDRCEGSETCANCEEDCGKCKVDEVKSKEYCGDRTCSGGETCETCSGDCGQCPAICGDGACNGDENCQTCAKDCGLCDTCANGGRDSGETDIDCGGVCGATCAMGYACTSNSDCAANYCKGNICTLATCTDDIRNGFETGMDCGGVCEPCHCKNGVQDENETGTDCGGVCGACPTCSDGIQNQGETGTDCGGPCPACQCFNQVQDANEGGTDCGGPCPACQCSNGIRDGGEEGIDCGGHCKSCPACDDGIRNQNEEGVDCGGPCEPCKKASCDDGVKNQGEEKVDCGGPCEPCKQKRATCYDGQMNQDETDIDCGGVCGATCEDGQSCLSDIDCTTDSCYYNTCTAPACDDGIQNQGETGTDCGGPCEPCGKTAEPKKQMANLMMKTQKITITQGESFDMQTEVTAETDLEGVVSIGLPGGFTVENPAVELSASEGETKQVSWNVMVGESVPAGTYQIATSFGNTTEYAVVEVLKKESFIAAPITATFNSIKNVFNVFTSRGTAGWAVMVLLLFGLFYVYYRYRNR